MPSNPMKGSDASRIQSSQAKGNNNMSSGGFAARAQSGAANNANAAISGVAGSGSKGVPGDVVGGSGVGGKK